MSEFRCAAHPSLPYLQREASTLTQSHPEFLRDREALPYTAIDEVHCRSEDTMAFAVPRHRASAGNAYVPEPGAATLALSDLSPGTSGRITRLLDDGVGGALIKRLRNLGFVPGRIATPLRRAPMGDPVVYRVSDYELCLRRKEARLVEVTAIEAETRIILQPRPAGRHAATDTEQTTGEMP